MRYLSEIFGDIPELFVHFYQMITNFLCVCQSISWIPYLLKLGQYGDISCSRWDVFHKFWETFHGCFYTISKLIQIICMSVSLLVDLLPYWNKTNIGIFPVLDEISSWFLTPPLPFGQMRSSTLVPSLTYFIPFSLPFFLPFSGRKLKIYVNIDARNLKFCMRHP